MKRLLIIPVCVLSCCEGSISAFGRPTGATIDANSARSADPNNAEEALNATVSFMTDAMPADAMPADAMPADAMPADAAADAVPADAIPADVCKLDGFTPDCN